MHRKMRMKGSGTLMTNMKVWYMCDEAGRPHLHGRLLRMYMR
jgi:hypothetical protein